MEPPKLTRKGPRSCPRGPHFRDCPRLLVRCAVAASAGAATRAVRAAALHVGQQRRLWAHDLGERAPSADFIAPNRNSGGGAADADGEIGRASCGERRVDLGGRRIIKKKKGKFRSAALHNLVHDG